MYCDGIIYRRRCNRWRTICGTDVEANELVLGCDNEASELLFGCDNEASVLPAGCPIEDVGCVCVGNDVILFVLSKLFDYLSVDLD